MLDVGNNLQNRLTHNCSDTASSTSRGATIKQKLMTADCPHKLEILLPAGTKLHISHIKFLCWKYSILPFANRNIEFRKLQYQSRWPAIKCKMQNI